MPGPFEVSNPEISDQVLAILQSLQRTPIPRSVFEEADRFRTPDPVFDMDGRGQFFVRYPDYEAPLLRPQEVFPQVRPQGFVSSMLAGLSDFYVPTQIERTANRAISQFMDNDVDDEWVGVERPELLDRLDELLTMGFSEDQRDLVKETLAGSNNATQFTAKAREALRTSFDEEVFANTGWLSIPAILPVMMADPFTWFGLGAARFAARGTQLFARTAGGGFKTGVRLAVARNVIEGMGISAMQQGAREVRDILLPEVNELTAADHLEEFIFNVAFDTGLAFGFGHIEKGFRRAMAATDAPEAAKGLRQAIDAVEEPIGPAIRSPESPADFGPGFGLTILEPVTVRALNGQHVTGRVADMVIVSPRKAVVRMVETDGTPRQVAIGLDEMARVQEFVERAAPPLGEAAAPIRVRVRPEIEEDVLGRSFDVEGQATAVPDDPISHAAALFAQGRLPDELDQAALLEAIRLERGTDTVPTLEDVRDRGVEVIESIAEQRRIEREFRAGEEAERASVEARTIEVESEEGTVQGVLERLDTDPEGRPVAIFEDGQRAVISTAEANRIRGLELPDRVPAPERAEPRTRVGAFETETPLAIRGLEPSRRAGEFLTPDVRDRPASSVTADAGNRAVTDNVTVSDLVRITEAAGVRYGQYVAPVRTQVERVATAQALDPEVHSWAEIIGTDVELNQHEITRQDPRSPEGRENRRRLIADNVWKQRRLPRALDELVDADEYRELLALVDRDRNSHVLDLERPGGPKYGDAQWHNHWIGIYDALRSVLIRRLAAVESGLFNQRGEFLLDAATRSRVTEAIGEAAERPAITQAAATRRLAGVLGIGLPSRLPGDIAAPAARTKRARAYVNTQVSFTTDVTHPLPPPDAPLARRRQAILVDIPENNLDHVSPEAFRDAVAANPASETLPQYSVSELRGDAYQLRKLRGTEAYWAMRRVRAGEHWAFEDANIEELAGDQIDIVSVINNEPREAEMHGLVTPAAMLDGIEQGGTVLDAYDVDGFLPGRYGRFGFVEVHRTAFDPGRLGKTRDAQLQKQAALARIWEQTSRGRWTPQYDTNGFLTNGPDVVVMRWSGDDALRRRARESYLRTGSIDPGGSASATRIGTRRLRLGDVGVDQPAGPGGVRPPGPAGRPTGTGPQGLGTGSGDGGHRYGDHRTAREALLAGSLNELRNPTPDRFTKDRWDLVELDNARLEELGFDADRVKAIRPVKTKLNESEFTGHELVVSEAWIEAAGYGISGKAGEPGIPLSGTSSVKFLKDAGYEGVSGKTATQLAQDARQSLFVPQEVPLPDAPRSPDDIRVYKIPIVEKIRRMDPKIATDTPQGFGDSDDDMAMIMLRGIFGKDWYEVSRDFLIRVEKKYPDLFVRVIGVTGSQSPEENFKYAARHTMRWMQGVYGEDPALFGAVLREVIGARLLKADGPKTMSFDNVALALAGEPATSVKFFDYQAPLLGQKEVAPVDRVMYRGVGGVDPERKGVQISQVQGDWVNGRVGYVSKLIGLHKSQGQAAFWVGYKDMLGDYLDGVIARVKAHADPKINTQVHIAQLESARRLVLEGGDFGRIARKLGFDPKKSISFGKSTALAKVAKHRGRMLMVVDSGMVSHMVLNRGSSTVITAAKIDDPVAISKYFEMHKTFTKDMAVMWRAERKVSPKVSDDPARAINSQLGVTSLAIGRAADEFQRTGRVSAFVIDAGHRVGSAADIPAPGIRPRPAEEFSAPLRERGRPEEPRPPRVGEGEAEAMPTPARGRVPDTEPRPEGEPEFDPNAAMDAVELTSDMAPSLGSERIERLPSDPSVYTQRNGILVKFVKNFTGLSRVFRLPRAGSSPSLLVRAIYDHLFTNPIGPYLGTGDGRLQGKIAMDEFLRVIQRFTQLPVTELLEEALILGSPRKLRAAAERGDIGLARRIFRQTFPNAVTAREVIIERMADLGEVAETIRAMVDDFDAEINSRSVMDGLTPELRRHIESIARKYNTDLDGIATIADRLLKAREGRGLVGLRRLTVRAFMGQLFVFRAKETMTLRHFVEAGHALKRSDEPAPALGSPEADSILRETLRFGNVIPEDWQARVAAGDDQFVRSLEDRLRDHFNQNFRGHVGRDFVRQMLSIVDDEGRPVMRPHYDTAIERFGILMRKLAMLKKLRILTNQFVAFGYDVRDIPSSEIAPRIVAARFTQGNIDDLDRELTARIKAVHDAVRLEIGDFARQGKRRGAADRDLRIMEEELKHIAGLTGRSAIGDTATELVLNWSRFFLLPNVQTAQFSDYGMFVGKIIAQNLAAVTPNLLRSMRGMTKQFGSLNADEHAEIANTLPMLELLIGVRHGDNMRLLADAESPAMHSLSDQPPHTWDRENITGGLNFAGFADRANRASRSLANLRTLGTMSLTRRLRHWVYDYHRMVSVSQIPRLVEGMRAGMTPIEAIRSFKLDPRLMTSLLEYVGREDLFRISDLITSDRGAFVKIRRHGQDYYVPRGLAASSNDPELRELAQLQGVRLAGGESLIGIEEGLVRRIAASRQEEASMEAYASWLNHSIRERLITPMAGSRIIGANRSNMVRLVGFLMSFISQFEDDLLRSVQTSHKEYVGLVGSAFIMSAAVWWVRAAIAGELEERLQRMEDDPVGWTWERLAWSGYFGALGERAGTFIMDFADPDRLQMVRMNMRDAGMSLPVIAATENMTRNLSVAWTAMSDPDGVTEKEFKRMWAFFSLLGGAPFQGIGTAMQQFQVPGFDDRHPLRDFAMWSDAFTVRREPIAQGEPRSQTAVPAF